MQFKMLTNRGLLAVCILQFALLYYYVLMGGGGVSESLPPSSSSAQAAASADTPSNAAAAPEVLVGAKERISTAQSVAYSATSTESSTPQPRKFSGMAVTLMLHSPKWFQRRYTAIVQNMLNNVPLDWGVQIFYIASGGSQRGLDINPGIGRLVEQGRVVLTPMPEEVWRFKSRRSDFFLIPWFWESILADKVLLFGGNSVICSNSFQTLANYSHFDYLGGPWRGVGGVGGSGEISLRSRPLMVQILKEQMQRTPEVTRDFTNKWGMEDEFFVKSIVAMQKANPNSGITLASYEDCLQFSSKDNNLNFNSLVATGTLAASDDMKREEFLAYCPELKVIFPVLHNPNCFGAEPNAEKCAASICALKPDRKGGC